MEFKFPTHFFSRHLMRLFTGLSAAAILSFAAPAYAQLSVTDLSGGVTANDLAQSLAGTGVTISNVTFTGNQLAAGNFSGGNGIIGFADGIILSTGSAQSVKGPNVDPGITTDFGGPGDTDLDALTGGFTTQDAAVLEFDFVPQGNTVNFLYVFASDEYNEFVNSSFNDVFAFFVNGTNCALVGTDPVSINTINNGNPFGTPPVSHPELFINNDVGSATLDTEMDGLTKVLTCHANVNSGVTNHMKLAIADTSDGRLDADVFIQAGSLNACQPTTEICNGIDDDCDGVVDNGCTTTGTGTGTGTSGAFFEGGGCGLQRGEAPFSGGFLSMILFISAMVAYRWTKTHSRKSC